MYSKIYLKHVPLDQLFDIIGDENFHDLTFVDKNKYFPFKNTHNFFQPFYFSFLTATIPIDFFYTMTCFLNLGMFIYPAGLAFLIIALTIFAVNFNRQYKKNKLENELENNYFRLLNVKFNACYEIQNRYLEEFYIKPRPLRIDAHIFELRSDNNHYSILNISALTLATGYGLFSSYCSISSFIQVLGFVSLANVMTGIVGLAIAISIFVAVGLLFSLKYEEILSNQEKIKDYKKNTEKDFKKNYDKCHQFKLFKKTIDTISTDNKLINDHRYANDDVNYSTKYNFFQKIGSI